MKLRKHLQSWIRQRGKATLLLLGLWAVTSCGGDSMHRGRMPFCLLERSPVGWKAGSAEMEQVELPLSELQPGDVVAFWMGHDESLDYLRRGVFQKIPYELFQYGHVALVVESSSHPRDMRLLQLAMAQAANVDEGLDYLENKKWQVFRPPSGTVDPVRLREFVDQVVITAADPKRAYDYPGVLGWKNAPFRPETLEDIGSRYSCATLVVAALHYAGYELDAVYRGGRLDVVTPKQVVMSRGIWRETISEDGDR